MAFYEITKGAQARPVRCVTYGPEGVGKTTFAAKWPGAVFIDVEDGSGHYDVARLPRPESWTRLLDEIAFLAFSEQCQTVVVDTADAAEALCMAHVLANKNLASVEDAGYGRGWTYLADEFSKLFAALDACIAEGKNVVVLAHSQIKKFEQPDEMGAYDRYELKLSKKCAPLLKEWCDLLLFANFKTEVLVSKDGSKVKAEGGKKRVMHASHAAAWDAKNRLGLPDEMPFDFSAIAGKITAKPSKETKQAAQPQPLKVAVFEDATEPEFKRLHELMKESGVTEAQLRAAVGSRDRNPYTEKTPIGDYSAKFVRDTLIAHWSAIVKTVRELNIEPLDDMEIPF